jgi:hypothetical protein
MILNRSTKHTVHITNQQLLEAVVEYVERKRGSKLPQGMCQFIDCGNNNPYKLEITQSNAEC